jgi:putative ABC transport system substrate-binding protein
MLIFSDPQTDPNTEAFRRGLRELGYIEGQTIAIEYRYAQGKPERFPELAAELVRLRPDVLFALGGDGTPHLRRTTQTIPIVYAMSADPVKLGLAASLARPGGNATGVTFLSDELAAKRLEILKEAVPHTSRVGFIWNPDHADNELDGAKRAAAAHRIQLHPIEMRSAADLDGARVQRCDPSRHRRGLRGVLAAYGGKRPTHRRICDQEPSAAGRRMGRMGASWRTDFVWSQRRGDGSPCRGLR